MSKHTTPSTAAHAALASFSPPYAPAGSTPTRLPRSARASQAPSHPHSGPAHTTLSPHTINQQLAAVKRLITEAAAQGYLAVATAAAFASVSGVTPQALKHRLNATARTRITPGDMRRLCDAPCLHTLRGRRDRALLATL
jgi:hypothetical protein